MSNEPIRVDGVLCHPRNLLVKVDKRDALEVVQLNGYRVIESMPQIGWAVVEAPEGRLAATKRALAKIDGIAACTLDRAAKLAYTLNDPLWTNQWHMRQIKADLAWDVTLGTNLPIVAVIDTGVYTDHPDLSPNVWTNPGEIPGNSIDDDGNGYVDDVHGYDFAYNDSTPNDNFGHGTGCAGIVAGRGDNGIGVSGVAPRARIMAVKAALDSGYFYDSATVPAYIYAADNGASVFSMSYYADGVSQAEEDALKYAYNKGVLPVAAAGNDSSALPYYPAAYEFVLSVAATDSSNNKAGFSNHGWWVGVAAPGVSLTTTANNGNYMGFSGTSGACPHVAGLAALLKGATKKAPNRSTLRTLIEDTATILTQAPYGEFSLNGLVNAQSAMNYLTTKTTPPPHAAKVSFATPIGYVAPGKTGSGRIYGRNLTGGVVKVGGVPVTVTSTSRQFINFELAENTGPITVEDASGNLLATMNPPIADKQVWPMNEASCPGGYVDGTFFDTLAPDSKYLKGFRRGDGSVLVQMSFRKLPAGGRVRLVLKRSYFNGTAGTEKVQLYRWATWSYPYGPFEDLATTSLPLASPDLVVTIPDITPYIDDERTMYLRIYTTDTPANTELRLDTAYFKR